MSELNLDELLRLAKAATPDAWEQLGLNIVTNGGWKGVGGFKNNVDVLFCVAAQPSTIIKLVEMVKERDAKVRDMRRQLSEAAREINCAGPIAHRIRVLKSEYEAELHQLREQRSTHGD